MRACGATNTHAKTMLEPGLIVLTVCNFFFSLVMTGVVRRYALQKSLLDHPNERSSHARPTPRGGGLAIVLAVFLSLGVMIYLHWLTPNLFLAFICGGTLVAVTGWIDDHHHLSPYFWLHHHNYNHHH